jgi:hypothetical protein
MFGFVNGFCGLGFEVPNIQTFWSLTLLIELEWDGAEALQQLAVASTGLLQLSLSGLDELGSAVGRDGHNVVEALTQLTAQTFRGLHGLWARERQQHGIVSDYEKFCNSRVGGDFK